MLKTGSTVGTNDPENQPPRTYNQIDYKIEKGEHQILKVEHLKTKAKRDINLDAIPEFNPTDPHFMTSIISTSNDLKWFAFATYEPLGSRSAQLYLTDLDTMKTHLVYETHYGFQPVNYADTGVWLHQRNEFWVLSGIRCARTIGSRSTSLTRAPSRSLRMKSPTISTR